MSARREAAEETLEHSTLLVSIRQRGLVSLGLEMPPSFLWVLNGGIGKKETLGMPRILQRVGNEYNLKSYLHEMPGLDAVIPFCTFKTFLNLPFPAGKLPGLWQISPASGKRPALPSTPDCFPATMGMGTLSPSSG